MLMIFRWFAYLLVMAVFISIGSGFFALGAIYGVWWGWVESVRDFIVLCKGDDISSVQVGWLLARFFILASAITGMCFFLGSCCMLIVAGMVGTYLGKLRRKNLWK